MPLGDSALEAKELLTVVRDSEYGDPVRNYQRAALIATQLTGLMLKPVDVVNVMIAVKLAREATKHKRDNIVDAIAYLDMRQAFFEEDAKDLEMWNH